VRSGGQGFPTIALEQAGQIDLYGGTDGRALYCIPFKIAQ